jgi:hypothetical protein
MKGAAARRRRTGPPQCWQAVRGSAEIDWRTSKVRWH